MSDAIKRANEWLNSAYCQLADRPGDTLLKLMHPSITSGMGWEPEVDQVFKSPEGPEEAILRGEIRAVVQIALTNAIAKARRRMEEDEVSPPCTVWNSMDIGTAFALAERVALFDPVRAVRAKLELDRLSMRVGESLFSIARTPHGIYVTPNHGLRW